MATFETRNGRTRAVIRRTDLRASKTFATLADAKVWARARERAADLGDVLAPGMADGDLHDLLERYQSEIWPIKRWSRGKAHELKALDADLGNTPLARLTRQTVIDYAQRLAKRMGRPAVATRLSYLRAVLTTARDLWHLPTPVAAVDEALAVLRHHKVVGRGNPRTRRATPEEIKTLIAHARETQRSPKSTIDLDEIITILDTLPLRVGELLSIEWSDLRPKERAVVLRSRKHPDAAVRVGNDALVPLIKVGKIDTFELINSRPRYLTRPFPYSRGAVSSAFWLAVLSCGIGDLHLHDLRAGAISKLFEMGLGIPLVALVSGHRNWKVLQRHYARVEPAAVHDAITRVQAQG